MSHSTHKQHTYPHFKNDKEALINTWKHLLKQCNDRNDKQLAIDLAYAYSIPNEIRSNAWFIISGARDLMSKNATVYTYLTETTETSINNNNKRMDQIEKDLSRSFRCRQMLHKYQHKLRRILRAYSLFNPSLSYTQGMNYIAAFIIKQYFETATTTIIDPDNTEIETKTENGFELVNRYNDIEQQSFWTFAAIMARIGTLFSNDLIGFHVAVDSFKNLFSYHGPNDLLLHLNTEDVYGTIFTVWFHTLFTHPSMNESMGKRIWDVFIMEQMDFSIVLKISYLVLMRHRSRLMKMEFMEITTFCKSEQCFVFNNKDDHDLIYRASRLQLNEIYLKPIRNLKYVNVNKMKDKEPLLDRLLSYFKMLIASNTN